MFIVGPDISAPDAITHAVDATYFDPAYNPGAVADGHDTGLVHIQDGDLPVTPLKIADTLSSDIVGNSVVVIGYGVTSTGGTDDSGIKRIAQLQIDSLDAELIGASAATPGTCSGDSGGPVFVYDDDGFPVIVATTSFGFANCQGGGYYQRVDAELSFISVHVGAGLCFPGIRRFVPA